MGPTAGVARVAERNRQPENRARDTGRSLVVADIVDLHRIARRGLIPAVGSHQSVQLELGAIDADARADYEHRLTRYGRRCGCTAGAMTILTLLSIWLLARMRFGPLADGVLAEAIGLGVAIAVGVFTIKVGVVVHARRKLRAVVAEVEADLRGGSR